MEKRLNQNRGIIAGFIYIQGVFYAVFMVMKVIMTYVRIAIIALSNGLNRERKRIKILRRMRNETNTFSFKLR